MLCLVLSIVTSSAKAGSSPASQDANSPSTPQQDQPTDTPNDPNAPAATLQDAKPQAKGQPKPTVELDAIADSAPQTPAKPQNDGWLIARKPTSDLARKIWRDRMSVPKSPKKNETKNQLRQLIDRIRTIKFKPQEEIHKPVVIVEPIVPPEANTTIVHPQDQNQIEIPQEQTAQSKSQTGTLSAETLKIITESLKHPKLLENPFELGEILFNAGLLNEAAACYSQALTRIDPNYPDPTEKRPWILFQIGACQRKNDPTKALEAYSRLINEHAGSLWTELAKAHINIINWREQDKPKMLIEESRPKSIQDAIPPELILTTKSKTDTE